MKRKPALLLYCGFFFLVACAQSVQQQDAGMEATVVVSGLPEISICEVPNPAQPSSAFHREQSIYREGSGYWVNYSCKQTCDDWRSCKVPAYADDGAQLLYNGRNPDQPKQALAFVVDGMAGHLALSDEGNKTVFIHTGAGGTRYYIKPAYTLEQRSQAKTVMIRWEKGYTSPIVQAPFTRPITWGWYSRTSAAATNIKDLNKRVASIIAWSHENLAKTEETFGTLGCSMGTNATFGPVLWHGLDPIIDYQLFVGGPNMWDLNAQCGRRTYAEGYCDLDGVTACKNDSDCGALGAEAHCKTPGPYTTIDLLFAQLPNHIHTTDACDIRASSASTKPFPGFDTSSMGFADGADWDIDHRMDFLVNLGAEQGNSYKELGGDEYWALGHFLPVYNKIKPDKNKNWKAYPNSHHCGAMFNEALDVIKEQMDL